MIMSFKPKIIDMPDWGLHACTTAASYAWEMSSSFCFGKEGPIMWKVSLNKNTSLILPR